MDMLLDGLFSQFSKIYFYIRRLQFGNKAQLAFLEDLCLLIEDGIPANRAIEMMAQLSTGLTRDVALSIAQKISEGQPLAEGMLDWFSINVVEIIRAGEEGGALAETIRSAVNTLGQRGSTIGSLIAAVTYPLIVITIACTIIVYLNNSVFTQFKAIRPIEEWPDAGRELISIAEFIQSWWWLTISLIIAVVLVLRSMLLNYIGDLRPMLDNVPPFSIYRRFAAARLMETLGLLVANGVVFKQAIKVMQYRANPYLASHLVMMEHFLGMGTGNIADVLSTGLIAESDILRLRVMAEVKGFEHGLIRMGVHGAEQNTRVLKLIAKIIGGILLAAGGMLIMIIVRGIYLTGMSMGSV
jgi:type II secretory pathway component PulF